MDIEAASDFGTGHLSARQRRVAIVVVLLAFFMNILDSTIVNVAVPSIQSALGADPASIQWIIAGYLLAFALFLITGGRLGDILGYKRMFLAGMAGFTIASVLCGFSATTEVLIVARFAQGAAAAIMVPQIMSLIQILYPKPSDRQNMSAFYGSLAGLAAVAGPVIGAALIAGDAFGLGWRAIFLVNVPVGIAAFIAAVMLLPDARSPHPLKIDIAGMAMTLLGMLLLIYPLIEGRERGWPLWCLISLALSLPVFIVFGWMQVRKQRRDGSPLVVPGLFLRRSFFVGSLIATVFFGMLAGFFLILSIFMQVGAKFPVLEAGLTGIPFSIAVAVSSGLTGPFFVPRFGRSVLTFGALLMAFGLALLAATVHVVGVDITPLLIIPSLVVAGIGMGLVVSPIFAFVLADVPLRDAGSASGVISAIEQVAGAVGVALIGLVFFSGVGDPSVADGAHYAAGFEHAALVAIISLIVIGILTRFLPARLSTGAAGHGAS